MNSTKSNFWIDLVTFAIAVLATGTGFILRWTLPPGSGGMTFWGLRRHDWGDVHFYLICALAAVVVLHVALHWPWVCLVTSRLLGRTPPSRRNGNLCGFAILALLTIVLGGFVLYSSSRVEPGHGGGQHRARARSSEDRVLLARETIDDERHE